MLGRVLALLLLLPPVAWPCTGTDGYSTEVCADNPTRYYRMDATSGTTETDIGSNARNATYTGGFTLNQTGALTGSGSTSPSVAFASASNGRMVRIHDGISGLGDCNPRLGSGQGWTLEAWVNPTSIPGAGIIASCTGPAPITSANAYMYAYYTSGVVELSMWNTSGGGTGVTVLSYGAGPSTSVWTHYVLTTVADSSSHISSAVLYKNGVQVQTGSYTAVALKDANASNAIDWTSGELVDGTNFPINGRVDELAVYQTALSSARALAHYNAGIAAASINFGRRIFQSRRDDAFEALKRQVGFALPMRGYPFREQWQAILYAKIQQWAGSVPME